ncbi:MAG: peptidase S41 [Cytophagales bacterium]|nr:MAG: peptidase S41 [Cytophagales bacterium]
MKPTLLFVIYALLAGAAVSLRAQPLTEAEARDDIQFLKRRLDQFHPGVGFYTPKPQYERLYDSLFNHLSGPVEYLPFFRHVSPLVNSLKDGHTNLNHRRTYIDKHTLYIPFFIRNVGADYYITHNVAGDTTFRRGTQLLSIEGRQVADIHHDLMEADRSGSDGDNRTGRQQWSLHQFADYYAAWFGSFDSLTISYRLMNDPLRLIRQKRVACVNLQQFRATLSKRYRHERDDRPNLSLQIIDSLSNTAVLRVSSFMGPTRHDPFQVAFKRRLKRAFRQVRDNHIENLIIDMQQNGGGMVVNSGRLLQYWMPNRFTIMQREQMKRAARAELVTRWNPFSALQFSMQYKPEGQEGFASRAHKRRFRPVRKLAYRGNLYFLMNGASFSAATSVLAKSLDAGVGTFVGEACGGAYWGDFAGHFKTITLPHSRIQVRIPLKKLTHAVSLNQANGFTIEPDFEVSRTYDDLLHSRDYALQQTLTLIQEGVTARKPRDSEQLAVDSRQ